MEAIKVKTLKNEFEIESYSGFVEKGRIKTDKPGFSELCRKGCKNYNKKYSCPPFAPDFSKLAENYDGMFVILFLCRLDKINSKGFNKVRIANAVMKSRMEKLIRHLEKTAGTCLSTGACRLCKPCKCVFGEPCKHPNKKRYSLESTGINCNELAKEAFGMPLLWYKHGKMPEYSSIICGVLCKKSDAEKIREELGKKLES